jgi:hypothetical protein
MPHKSRAEMLRFLRKRLTSPERWIDALLIIEAHTGEELFRVGGCWDTHRRCFVDRPCKPRTIRLQESQMEIGKALARWLEKARKGEPRSRVLMGGGPRGSGKTWLLAGLAFVVMALVYPNDWQFGINITAKQKRECIEAIREVAAPEWIASDVEDFRDPRTIFITGSTIAWKSAQAPRAIREGGLRIRYVLINEGQDQPVSVANNAVAVIRNVGGLLGVATNPPQTDRSDWVANWWQDIEAGTLNGERYFLDNRLNRAIDQDAVGDIAAFLRSSDPTAYEADAVGEFKVSGPIAYPGFSSLPREKGGHVGEPPAPVFGLDGKRTAGWLDVTVEETSNSIESSVGFPFVIGVDFQKHPGVTGQLGKLYRDEEGNLILFIIRTIAVRGVEADFSQALHAAGFAPSAGQPTSVLLIADATGARQNAEHKYHEPSSYKYLKADGWFVQPPMRHWRTRVPWNPLVADSRDQMHGLFLRHRIVLSQKCEQPTEGFHSLVESFRKAKTGPKGGLLERGGYQHNPDGVRYLAWRFLPRARPNVSKDTSGVGDALRGTKILMNG